MLAQFLHFLSISLIVTLPSLGTGISGGWATDATIDAINTQPQADIDISRLAIIGLALTETAAILGIVFGLILLQTSTYNNLYVSIAEIGIAIAIGTAGLTSSIASSYPVQSACKAIARQPFFSQNILNIMLLTQSIIQTPIIFAFLISLLINAQLHEMISFGQAFQFFSGGFCIGIASIGPGLGLGAFAYTACEGLGINRHAYPKLLPFAFISQAIIETPIVFALLISLLLIQTSFRESFIDTITLFAAALCMGLGTLSPGLSSARTAQAACRQIAFNPEHSAILSKTSIIGQALIDAAAIYALLIALLLIFF